MTIEERHQRITQLNEELKTATPERYEDIVEELAVLREPCYECEEKKRTEEHFPFCSTVCHTAWSDREYGPEKTKNPRASIDELQKRALEAGKRAAQRVLREGVSK
jgi:endogenous inhibitor of DNA gyrase (YacG/DUF329 family)